MSNKLSLSTQNTYYMIFHWAKLKEGTQANCFKYFAVIIDYKLNWSHHIIYMQILISKGIGIIYNARKYLDKKALQHRITLMSILI